ncbi:MAG: ribokinase [Actinobacteria bacterium]|nr:ribokinase [Actinomycetota bacterium]
MSREVVVVGSANADLVVQVPRRPAGGETLLGGDLQLLPGGKGANQAAAAGRCGADVAFIGCVGGDANGAYLREQLTAAGVDTSLLGETERPSGTAIIFLTPDGENSIVVSPGANSDFDIAQAERSSETWKSARVVVLSLEIPHITAFHVAAQAAEAGARVILNAAPSTRLAAETLAVCDPLIVNEHEALEVLGVGEDDPDARDYPRLAERLREAGARSVVITLGADGAVIAEAEGLSSVPAYRVQAVDTTGAGDAFVGAVAGELAAGAALTDAVRFATAVSAVAVQRVGAQASYADRAEVEAFIASTS